MSTPNTKPVPADQPAAPQTTAESLGWQLRAALPPLRLHSVSLYDRAGEVLWLSEGALGPDENAFVLESLEALTGNPSTSHREIDFGDGRGAVFLAVRSPQSELAGLVMILVDTKALSSGGLSARIITPAVRSVLQRLAILLRPPASTPGATATAPLPVMRVPPTARGQDTAATARMTAAAETSTATAETRTTTTQARTAAAQARSTITQARTATAQARTGTARARTATAALSPATPRSTASVADSLDAVSSTRAFEVLEWSPPDSAEALEAVPADLGSSGERSSTMALPAPIDSGDTTGDTTEEVLAPQAVDKILTFELTEELQHLGAREPIDAGESPHARDLPRTGEIPRTSEPPRADPPTHTAGSLGARAGSGLYVRELVRLRPGGRTRHLQIVPSPSASIGSPDPRSESEHAVDSPARTPSPGGFGGATRSPEQAIAEPLRELAVWLEAHPALADGATLNFSIAIPSGALELDELPELIKNAVRSARLPTGCIGFEIVESAGARQVERAERLARALERLGCFLVLDDFAFDSGALELLRSKALRLVKVDRKLVGAALRDKLAQARLVGISQAARVLGIHCVAKHVDAQATHRWLAAVGFDFAEGPLFGGPRSLASLAGDAGGRA